MSNVRVHLLLLLCIRGCCHGGENIQDTEGTVPGSRRSPNNGKDWDRAFREFRETVTRDFLQSELPDASLPVTSPTAWLLTIIQSTGPTEESAWVRLDTKNNEHTAESLEDENVKTLNADIKYIMGIMSKAKNDSFTKSDLSVVKTLSPNFLPQTYNSVNFTVKWMDAMSKYMTILAAGYIDLMKTGDYDDCRLAEQLNMFKPQIIDAARKLAKARYKSLEKVSWSGGAKRFKTTASLTIRDAASGKLFDEIPLSQLTARLLTPMKLQMADFIMKHFVAKYNALYNDSWIGDSCTLTSLITVQDLEFGYPDACMDADGSCKLPCGNYMENKTWCPTNIKGNRWESSPLEKFWDECNPPDWDKCMFIEQLQPIVWSEGYEKLKRKINDNMFSSADQIINADNTFISLLSDDEEDADVTLRDSEKKILATEIANKIKVNKLGLGDTNTTSNQITKRTSILEQEKDELVEAFFVKAILSKRKNGNITSFLEKLKKSAVYILS